MTIFWHQNLNVTLLSILHYITNHTVTILRIISLSPPEDGTQTPCICIILDTVTGCTRSLATNIVLELWQHIAKITDFNTNNATKFGP
jgi:hypothetical protein